MNKPEKAADPLKEQEKNEDQKLSEPQMEKKAEKKGRGKLVCRFTVRGEGDDYKPGDVYEGKRGKELLKKGAIVRE